MYFCIYCIYCKVLHTLYIWYIFAYLCIFCKILQHINRVMKHLSKYAKQRNKYALLTNLYVHICAYIQNNMQTICKYLFAIYVLTNQGPTSHKTLMTHCLRKEASALLSEAAQGKTNTHMLISYKSAYLLYYVIHVHIVHILTYFAFLCIFCIFLYHHF
jgi:hypothetical protein